MKKTILFQAALFCALFAHTQIVFIPDSNFKAVLLNHNPVIDLNSDGEIQVSEAEAMTGTLNIWQMQIHDMTGIEAFVNLIGLNCVYNYYLSYLNLSGNVFIKDINCECNNIDSLILGTHPDLLTLSCRDNELLSLDISNCPNLEYLDCSHNEISFLNLGNHTDLLTLSCCDNELLSLDISNCPNLEYLDCSNNEISFLNLGNHPDLLTLNCSRNNLLSLDISNNHLLIELNSSHNLLSTIDVSNNTALEFLHIWYNNISSLNISSNITLKSLDCSFNLLSDINISNNTDLEYLDVYHNSLIDLDVSNNTLLTGLYCSSNQITSLDVSNNEALEYLHCASNQLSSLDISNLYNLNYLYCSYNQLTTLTLGNNNVLSNLNCGYNQLQKLEVCSSTSLQDLNCENNQLDSLDVSGCLNLSRINCSYNELTSFVFANNANLYEINCAYNQIDQLDLSNNYSLHELFCNDNQLERLNLKTNDSLGHVFINAANNPDLFCIEVNDPVWYTDYYNYYYYIDPQTSYASNCLYDVDHPNRIEGSVIVNDTCSMNGYEQAMEGIIVRTYPDNFFGITGPDGIYSIETDSGSYTVEAVFNNPLITPLCPLAGFYQLVFDTLAKDTTGIDFFYEQLMCPYLTIDLSSDRRRRCFRNNTFVHYCNDGFAEANGVQVQLTLPDYVNFISADMPCYADSAGNYIFAIGTLVPGECGDIHIIDSVSCIIDITGLTQCTEVWITPVNDCLYNLDTTAMNQWDHSSVMVEGFCLGDTIISFAITNTGDAGAGDMQSPSEYRIFADMALVFTGMFQLDGQEQLIIDIPATGQTFRLEANQHPMHPGNSHPNATVEACGNDSLEISTGFFNSAPMDDADSEVEIDCMEIIDSFDPNDKSVSPQSSPAGNFILQGSTLEYVIRFQNTGTDIAYTVVVVDTLSEYLDISTFQPGISSHPYSLDVRGQGRPVLVYTFSNINLTDSTTDEPNSHGFVKFKIATYDSLPNGTEVSNTADIYFDYNLPVTTNPATIVLSDSVVAGLPIAFHNKQPANRIRYHDIRVAPNPFLNRLEVYCSEEAFHDIRMINILGEVVMKVKAYGTSLTLETGDLPPGSYMLRILTGNKTDAVKVIKQ